MMPAKLGKSLRVFVSYPGADGRDAALLFADELKGAGHRAWVWDYHKFLGVPVFRQISECVGSNTDVFLFICTKSSRESLGQEMEAGYALNYDRVLKIPILWGGAQQQDLPSELVGLTWARIPDGDCALVAVHEFCSCLSHEVGRTMRFDGRRRARRTARRAEGSGEVKK